MGNMRNAYKILIRKPQEKRQFWRHGYRWMDNIKMGLLRIGYEGVD